MHGTKQRLVCAYNRPISSRKLEFQLEHAMGLWIVDGDFIIARSVFLQIFANVPVSLLFFPIFNDDF